MKIEYRIRRALLAIFILCATTAFAQDVVTIQKNETKELANGSHIKELIIYGDNSSVGQVKVTDGVVTIDKVIYKYSFTPNDWHHISFPIDVDLSKMSNLNDIGIEYNIQQYNSSNKSSGLEPWVNYTAPTLKALTGYRILLPSALTTSIEVIFLIDQIKLDTETCKTNLYISLDMENATSGVEKVLYIKGKNIKSNVLKLDVTYSPTESDMLPMNYEQELENARIVNTIEKKGIRLTLPTNEPTKIVILNKKGDKVLKKILYTAPAEIDLSDLKKREYQMIINYGTATTIKTFKLK